MSSLDVAALPALDDRTPLLVYGSEISYFTGKLEAYLRYKEIPYERIAMSARYVNRVVPRATGVAQMPAVVLPDGRWMTDTTPMIAWLEKQHPEPPVIPRDPLQAFASRLVEDYADEWLWRPAMHYRWSHRPDALLLSRRIVTELLAEVPAPPWLKRWAIRRRQHGGYVRGDGVTARTRAHVEGIYLRTLASLEAMLATRPFLLGGAPTLADFGFFGSMFRHFALDPTPGALMRERAGVRLGGTRVECARESAAGGAPRRDPVGLGTGLRRRGWCVSAIPLRQRRSVAEGAQAVRRRHPGHTVRGRANVMLPRLVPRGAAAPLRDARRARASERARPARAPRVLGAALARDGVPLRSRSRRAGSVLPRSEGVLTAATRRARGSRTVDSGLPA